MKKLFLLRHAEAAKKNGGSDFDRPLTEAGLKEAIDIGEFLLKKSWFPEIVICSSATRTKNTCSKVFEVMPSKPLFIFKQEIYNATANDILKLINHLESAVASLMVVGHNPGITAIIDEFNLNSNGFTHHANAMNYAITCKLVVLQFEGNSWLTIQNDKCTLKCVYWPFDISLNAK